MSKSIPPLEYCMHSLHDVSLDTLRLFLILNLLDTRASLVLGNTFAANHLSLLLPHTSIDVDVLGSDP